MSKSSKVSSAAKGAVRQLLILVFVEWFDTTAQKVLREPRQVLVPAEEDATPEQLLRAAEEKAAAGWIRLNLGSLQKVTAVPTL